MRFLAVGVYCLDQAVKLNGRPHHGHAAQTRYPVHRYPELDTETLLVHACESLASANVMASDLAGFLEGAHSFTTLYLPQYFE